MGITVEERIEALLNSLPQSEKLAVISHGAVLYLSVLRKRLSFAEEKIRQFEEKYNCSLDELDAKGLPDDADYLMHEDYIMWHHWVDTVEKLKEEIEILNEIATQGLCSGEFSC